MSQGHKVKVDLTIFLVGIYTYIYIYIYTLSVDKYEQNCKLYCKY